MIAAAAFLQGHNNCSVAWSTGEPSVPARQALHARVMTRQVCHRLNWERTTTMILLLLLAPLLASSSASTSAPPGFDYFVLALQWPGTVCRSSAAAGPCCSSNACCRSDPIGWFTIHGLWPNYAQGGGPTCCNNPDFDMAKISNLTTELNKYWPSLYCSSPSICSGGHGSLWAHEWEKHGSCSYPVIQDEYSYFSTALHLYSNYNVTAMLASKISIGADDCGKYLVTDLVATIRSSFGASPLLLCERGSLRELRLCFDKDLKPLNCINGEYDSRYDAVEQGRSSCPRRISLPSYKPHDGDTSGATRRFTANKIVAFIACVL